MDVVPDTKSWTWVLERACPECGLDVRSLDPAGVPDLVRENASAWVAMLTGARDVGRRPRPDVWSPLEYACHVRDVLVVFARRVRMVQAEDGVTFEDWDQDATAVAERYSEQDAHEVARELTSAAEAMAKALEAVQGGQWRHRALRSDGSQFTTESLARYFAHDLVHHRHDVFGG